MTSYAVTFIKPVPRVETFDDKEAAIEAARAGIPAVLADEALEANHHAFYPIVSFEDADGYEVQVGYADYGQEINGKSLTEQDDGTLTDMAMHLCREVLFNTGDDEVVEDVRADLRQVTAEINRRYWAKEN